MMTRVTNFKQQLADTQIDVALVLKPHDVFYFSGYSSVCSGVVITSVSEPIFCTLWLDAPEAKQLSAISKVASYVFPRENLMGRMIKLFQEQRVRAKRIGVEKDFILLRDYESLVEQFPDSEIVPYLADDRSSASH